MSLPILPSKNWVRGWRATNLAIGPDNRIRFIQINQTVGFVRPFGIDALATCGQRPWHVAPQVGCHCGFNAFEELSRLHEYLAHPWGGKEVLESIVVIEVALSGRIIAGTYNSDSQWGYKAERQVVIGIRLSPTCHICKTSLNDNNGYFRTFEEPGVGDGIRYLYPICANDAADVGSATALSVHQLRASLPDTTELFWDPHPPILREKPSNQKESMLRWVDDETRDAIIAYCVRHQISVTQIMRRAAAMWIFIDKHDGWRIEEAPGPQKQRKAATAPYYIR